MKTAISGPPSIGKTKIMQKLRGTPWIVENKYHFPPHAALAHLEKTKHTDAEAEYVQKFIFNDHVKNLYFSGPQQNIISTGSVLDAYTHTFKMSVEGNVSPNLIESATTSMGLYQHLYNVIYCIIPEKSDPWHDLYKNTIAICGDSNIFQVSAGPIEEMYSIILEDIKQKHEKYNNHVQNSNQWSTMFRQNFFVQLFKEHANVQE